MSVKTAHAIIEHFEKGVKWSKQEGEALAARLGTSFYYVKKIYYTSRDGFHQSPKVKSNKVLGDMDWRESIELIKGMQIMAEKAKSTQSELSIHYDTDKPICIVLLADLHMGSWGADYSAFQEMTDEILNTDGLYVILAGDLTQMAIKMRNVLEVSDNLLPPHWQYRFLESWMQEIKHKVICTTWENHAQMREEAAIGWSPTAQMLASHTAHFNGIGHIDLTVGEQIYKIAVSHFFRGNSMYNPCHSQMRYGKFEGQDRDIIMAGDTHTFGIASYTDGKNMKLALNCGSLHVNSGYGKRFFSLVTHPKFPCVVLHPDEKLFVPFPSVKAWLKSKA